MSSSIIAGKKISKVRKTLKKAFKTPVKGVTFAGIVKLGILVEEKTTKSIKIPRNSKSCIGSNKLAQILVEIVG